MNFPKSFSLALVLTPLLWTLNSPDANAESPIPGKSFTQASLLLNNPTSSQERANVTLTEETVAQTRRQRSVEREPFNPNYFGIGLNIGFDGETALGNTEFAVNSRIKLTPNVSFRPGAVIGGNAAILVPFTYDFTTRNVNVVQRSFSLTPYIGGGVFFTTDDTSEDDLGGLVTAGLDIPISRQFTANAGLNVGFVNEETEWGLLLGVGYNIPR